MSGFLAALEFFHFIRPWWLALIPAALALWWSVRTRATARNAPPSGIAPHLVKALTVGDSGRRRFLAIDGVAALIVLIGLGAAGPAWNRVPNPLVAQTAPLAIALAVTDSMLAKDVAPSRLERAKQKILDVIAIRTGARTALVAYAGSAHLVAPLTEDPNVLKPFLEGLSPDVMPVKGRNASAALELARSTLETEQTPGAILFVTDALERADMPAFERHAAEGGPVVVFLAIGSSAAELNALARVPNASVVRLTPDAGDVSEIERRVVSAYRDALARDENQKWQDMGWLLAWPATLLALIWFRRGWTMRWSLALIAALFTVPGGQARAGGIRDWFLTPDQQGRLAFEKKQYAEAAENFKDPMWQGLALYRNGKYTEAAEVFSRLSTADAAFAQGTSHAKTREYREAIAAFETALERDPDHAAAARNLEITRAILEYVESAREQSDTGEERGIGADDVVFDNDAARGTETTITGEEKVEVQTAEQWMRTVDTRTEDFLRTRFALEAAKASP